MTLNMVKEGLSGGSVPAACSEVFKFMYIGISRLVHGSLNIV